MSAKDARLIIGGQPRADLMPPEIKQGVAARAQRRGLMAIVVVVVLIVAGAYALVSFNSNLAQMRLEAANTETGRLLAEKAQYTEVQKVGTLLDTATAAQRIATSTEVDLGNYYDAIYDTLPSGVSVTIIKVDIATPLVVYPQSTTPLQPVKMGEFVLTVKADDLKKISQWLADIPTLPGYTDAIAGSADFEDGAYTTVVTMHFDQNALASQTSSELNQ